MKALHPTQGARPRLMPSALAAVVVAVGAVIWSFLESREELTREARREQPVSAAASVAGGSGIIHVARAAQERSGINTARLPLAPYLEEVRAYSMVLDAARLTEHSYANAEAQLRTARAKVTFSKAAFERAQMLYDNERSVSLALLQSAEAAFRTDEAGAGAAASQVRTLTATAYQEWGPVLGGSLVDWSATVVRLIERQDFLVQVTLPPGVAAPAGNGGHSGTGQPRRIRTGPCGHHFGVAGHPH
jgi:hypothetical protein